MVESAAQRENARYVGEIKGTGATITEMLEKTNESSLIHPARVLNSLSDFTDKKTGIGKSMSAILKESKDSSYTEHYAARTFPDGSNRRCNFWNCLTCHGSDDSKIRQALVKGPDKLVRKYMVGRSIHNKDAVIVHTRIDVQNPSLSWTNTCKQWN